MKVKITRSTFAAGEYLEAGKVYDLRKSDASTLQAMRYAVAAKEEKPAKKAPAKKDKK
jgi:hypothetical protein